MSTFRALNVDYDDVVDDEPDDTREVQIEEALKIYANALKYHSQGARTLKDAGEAYEELFKSEIFTYPESLSEHRRSELYGQAGLEVVFETALEFEPAAVSTETAPSTLPQILHLSYKNRGQYYLDLLESELAQEDQQHEVAKDWKTASQALGDFTDALDKDDDDVDLWRRAAKVGGVLGSNRIARFCLEGALDGDEQDTDDVLGVPNIETGIAAEDLVQLEKRMEDELSLAQTSPSANVPSMWRNQLQLYPFLPEALPKPADNTSSLEAGASGERTLDVETPTWSALVAAVLQQLRSEESGDTTSQPGVSWRINMPGMDASTSPTTAGDGEQTTQIRIDTDMTESTTQAATEDAGNAPVSASSAKPERKSAEPAPSSARKRTTEAANLSGGDGDKAGAKRPRTRKSLAAEEGVKSGEPASDYDFQIQSSMQADQWVFGTMNGIVHKLGVDGFGAPEALRALVSTETVPGVPGQEILDEIPLRHAIKDFYTAIQSWDNEKSRLLSQKNDSNVHDIGSPASQETGLIAFLESSNTGKHAHHKSLQADGLSNLVNKVNSNSYSLRDVAGVILDLLLCSTAEGFKSSYLRDSWDADMKYNLVQMLILMDDVLVGDIQADIDFASDTQNVHGTYDTLRIPRNLPRLSEFAQTIFELHLDVYSASLKHASGSDEILLETAKDRLNVWANLARDVIVLATDKMDIENAFQLHSPKLRHLWTTVYHLAKCEEITRVHNLACLDELKKTMLSHGDVVIDLPNNTTIPELSASAAEREISKLDTMDFFLSIFDKDSKPPVDLIEALEPLLEGAMTLASRPTTSLSSAEDVPTVGEGEVEMSGTDTSSASQTLLRFMLKTDISLRMLLWRRLRDAYEAIDYPPKIVSICLRTIELLMREVKSVAYAEIDSDERVTLLLGWLRECSELLDTVLQLTNDIPNAFECVDMDHLRSSIDALADLWQVLYAVALYDDYSTAGGKGGSNRNPFRFYPHENFHAASVQFHDMQAQTAVLLYKLIVEGMTQAPDAFEDSVDDRMVFLRHMHYHWGVRKLCKAGDQMFLKFMKDELVILGQPTKQVSDDLAQVLFDLYDIFTFSSSWEKWDHGCDPDYFDKDTALQILPFVMAKAENMNIKELMKSDLSKTIEKVNSTLGQIKSSSATVRNRKLLNAYLKGPLRPLELFRALEGVDEISAISLPAEDAPVAAKGWYFLRGQMILTRINAQRSKGAQIPDDDIQAAVTFFLQDLEYDPEHWETWFRLGQAYDALLEQQVLFSAEALNNEQEEVQNLQRCAIHAYAAAVAAALRNAEPCEETVTKMAELYTEFGTRMYASSRPPFMMNAFAPKDSSLRHFSGEDPGKSHYTLDLYSAMDSLTAWRFASNLFTRATKLKPDYWLNYFMLGKCLWKIHNAYDTIVADHPPTAVQDAVLKSVETLPHLKRADRQDPILDSIFRAVFIAHKLVLREDLDEEEGAQMIEIILRKQNQFEVPRIPDRTKFLTWPLYMLDVFRILRAADKKSWHHRIVNRAAELIYRIPEDPQERAHFAKDYLVDQHVYTKSYTITIWKPEYERPGRHWVYMTKYASFVARIFEETDDLEGMEILARRIRRKPNEYYEHTALWEEVCGLHLKLHRRHANIPDNFADSVFINIDMEEFNANAKLIDAWALSPTSDHPLRDVLRETAELKKLNGALMKTAAIDDLLGDTYAVIWYRIGPALRQAAKEKEAGQNAMDISTPTESAPGHSTLFTPQAMALPHRPDSRNVMSLTNMLHFDGASDSYPRPSNFPGPLTHQYRPLTPPRQTPTSTYPPGAGELTLTLTPSKPRARLISRREILKRASDTVAGLKTTASAAAAVASTKQAGSGSGTGSPMLAAEREGRSRRGGGGGGGVGGDERSFRIVLDGEGDAGPQDAGGDSDADADLGPDAEVQLEAEAEDEDKVPGDASRRGSVLERDGNDADDESGDDADVEAEADEAEDDANEDQDDDHDHEMQGQEPGMPSGSSSGQAHPPTGFAAAMQDKRLEHARDEEARAARAAGMRGVDEMEGR